MLGLFKEASMAAYEWPLQFKLRLTVAADEKVDSKFWDSALNWGTLGKSQMLIVCTDVNSP